jgi:hypothetical protein
MAVDSHTIVCGASFRTGEAREIDAVYDAIPDGTRLFRVLQFVQLADGLLQELR